MTPNLKTATDIVNLEKVRIQKALLKFDKQGIVPDFFKNKEYTKQGLSFRQAFDSWVDILRTSPNSLAFEQILQRLVKYLLVESVATTITVQEAEETNSSFELTKLKNDLQCPRISIDSLAILRSVPRGTKPFDALFIALTSSNETSCNSAQKVLTNNATKIVQSLVTDINLLSNYLDKWHTTCREKDLIDLDSMHEANQLLSTYKSYLHTACKLTKSNKDAAFKLILLAKSLIQDSDVDFPFHSKLLPTLWPMKKKVKKRLLKIADDFIKDLDLDPNIIVSDIILTGSSANYNWTSTSDLDLHIIVDTPTYSGKDLEMLKDYFADKKSLWNEEHDIKVCGLPVELYIQNSQDKLYAGGVYSLRTGWKVKPSVNVPHDYKKKQVKDKAESIALQIQRLTKFPSLRKIELLKDKLKAMRKSSLETSGEFGVNNLVYKALRRAGYLDKLYNLYNSVYDTTMSLN